MFHSRSVSPVGGSQSGRFTGRWFLVGGEINRFFEVGFFVVYILDVDGLGAVLGEEFVYLLLQVGDGFQPEDGGGAV